MNKEQILKIIDDLTKNNKKLRVKDLTNDEAIFVHFGAVKFLCDFETGPLKVIFQFARPVDTFFENDFEEFGKLKENFVANNTPWIRLDIAGTAYLSKPEGYLPKGATGIHVKTLYNLINK